MNARPYLSDLLYVFFLSINRTFVSKKKDLIHFFTGKSQKRAVSHPTVHIFAYKLKRNIREREKSNRSDSLFP